MRVTVSFLLFFIMHILQKAAKQMRTIRKTDVKVGKIKGYVRKANITSL